MKSARVVKAMAGAVSSLDEAQARLRRKLAIERAGDSCESCRFLAWSYPLQDTLQLREREGEPDRPHVLCPGCATKHDAKEAKRRRAS